MTVDPKSIEAKLEKGETLTQDEENWLVQEDTSAPDGYAKALPEGGPAIDEGSQDAPDDGAQPAPPAPPAAPDPSKEDFFVRLEREMAKPDGQADLKDFSSREKAYFHQMKRDKVARQKAEADRDAALFREAKLKKSTETPPPPDEDDPIVLLKKKDPTDFMTVEDVMKVVEKLNKVKEQPAPAAVPASTPPVDPVRLRYLQMCDAESRSAHPEDYDAVMELAADILNSNPQHLIAVQQAIARGENPAEKSYEIIKADPEFVNLFPRAQAKIEALRGNQNGSANTTQATPPAAPVVLTDQQKRAQAAQAALEKNKNKPKTTAHAGSGNEGSGGGDLSMDQIGAMSDLEFARLPKQTRARYLALYG